MRIDNLYENIRHVEDLALLTFINAVKSLEECNITEKIDGAHLRVHIDEDNQLYVTRLGKNDQKQYYSEQWFPNEPKYAFQRAGIACLERVEHDLRECGFTNGDWIDVEVIMSEQPNTIQYDGVNRVVFLESSGNIDLPQLVERLATRSVTCKRVPVYEVRDDLKLSMTFESFPFTFDGAPTVDGAIITESVGWGKIADKVAELESFLQDPCGMDDMDNFDLHELNLNKRPRQISEQRWKMTRNMLKGMREGVRNIVEGYKHAIKRMLIAEFVNEKKSKYNEGLDNGWIEGVVCKHKEGGATFKIVDRETFTEVNKFYYEVRNNLHLKPHNTEDANSFMGETRIRVASAFQMGDLGTRKAKKFLFAEGINEHSNADEYREVFTRLMDECITHNPGTMQEFLLRYLTERQEALVERYNEYVSELDNYTREIGGKTYSYAGEVDRRTRISFAEANEDLGDMYKIISDAKTVEDMVFAVVPKY